MLYDQFVRLWQCCFVLAAKLLIVHCLVGGMAQTTTTTEPPILASDILALARELGFNAEQLGPMGSLGPVHCL